MDINRCQNIINQINDHSQTRVLFTNNIGLENGFKKRSICFCIDRLWAWIKGTSYDKNQVANTISDAFHDLDFSQLNTSEEDLQNFYRNLRTLRDKFSQSSQFDASQMNHLLENVNLRLEVLEINHATDRSIAEGSPDPQNPSLSVREMRDYAETQFNGIFENEESRAYQVLTENLDVIEKQYPYLLEIHGDNDCFYKSLATLIYVQEQSTEDLADYQLNFARKARAQVAEFLKDPDNLAKIPQPILEGSFPDPEQLQEFIRDEILTEEGIIGIYGGTTKEEILNTIATPGKRAASNIELYVLSLIYGEFFDISFKCSLNSTDPNVKTTPYPYPDGDTKLADRKLDQENLPWENRPSPLSNIGFPIQVVAGHYHVALSEDAAQFLKERLSTTTDR